MVYQGLPLAGGDRETSMPLFEQMVERYLASTEVREWLFDRNPKQIRHTGMLDSFSYACMYYPPSFQPYGDGPYPLPKPFLDLGDFLVCHRLHDGFALGTLFNKNENHALSAVRDSMLKNSNLSSRPRARNFAIDLRLQHMEIIEFVWMDDDSLIIACRCLHPSTKAPEKGQVLSGDILYYPQLAPTQSIDVIPLMRMTLGEEPALCQFCGSVGVGTCRHPPSCKIRANSPHSFTWSKHSLNSFKSFGSMQNSQLSHVVAQSWPEYAKRMFRIDQVGDFFCKWYQRSPCRTTLVPSVTQRHPTPYQLVSGKKKDTLDLVSLYVQRLRLLQGTVSADLRLEAPLPLANPNQQLNPISNSNIQQVNDDHQHSSDTLSDILGPCVSVESFPLLRYTGARIQDSVPSIGHDSFSSSLTFPSVQLVPKPSTDEEIGDFFSDEYPENPGLSPPSVDASEQASSTGDQVDRSPPRAVVKYHDVSSGNRKERLNHFMSHYVQDNRCMQCEKTFSKRSNLVRHINTRHFNLKPFQCERCSKRFGHSNHLRRHMYKLHALNDQGALQVL